MAQVALKHMKSSCFSLMSARDYRSEPPCSTFWEVLMTSYLTYYESLSLVVDDSLPLPFIFVCVFLRLECGWSQPPCVPSFLSVLLYQFVCRSKDNLWVSIPLLRWGFFCSYWQHIAGQLVPDLLEQFSCHIFWQTCWDYRYMLLHPDNLYTSQR